MTNRWSNLVNGRQLLTQVKGELGAFRENLQAQQTRVAIIHFQDPGEQAADNLRTRIKAANVSTRAKLKTFRDLGVEPIEIAKPWLTSVTDFTNTIQQLNQDASVAGIIVQHPMRLEISRELQQIAPDKDLDVLTIRPDNPFQIPATSDAILRTAAPSTTSEPQFSRCA